MYKCNECGYTSNRTFYICPKCSNTDIEELNDVKTNTNKSSNIFDKVTSNRFIASDTVKSGISNKIKNVRSGDISNEFKVIKSTPFTDFNDIISSDKGFLESQVVMLSADPGTGKSTFCTQISSNDTIYISSEETFGQIKKRFMRCNPNSEADILATTSCEDALAAIEMSTKKFVIVDSINSFEGGTLSYARVAQFCQEIINIIKSTKKCGIIISQVSRNGETIGMASSIHAVDTCLSMSRSPISENITMVSTKNRFNETGAIALFRHEESGLVQVDQDPMEFSNGTVCFFMQNGSKKIPFSIQTLICGMQDSRPQRVGVGVNKNQIMLWNAIIGVNDNTYTTVQSDIYMSTSNGLILQPGNDVAAICSILSSYYNKVVSLNPNQLRGTISLNGNITGNMNFHHIRDIINLYKK